MLRSHPRTFYISDNPILLKFRSSRGFIGLTTFLATFVDGFLYGVLVPVLPFSLLSRSGVHEDDVQFWLTVFMMSFGLATLIGAAITGRFAARSSLRKTLSLAGLTLAFLATCLFGLGHEPWVLVIARACQGFSAPMINITSLVLITESVDSREIGSWLGFVLSGMNLGLLVSPSLGGAIYDMAGYDAVFALTLGLIVLVFVLRVAVVEKATATRFLTGGVPIPSDSGSKPTAVEPGTPPNRKNSGAKTVSQEGRAGSDETSPLLPGFSPKKSRNWLAAALPAIDVLLSSRRLRAAVYGGLIHTTIITAFDTVLPLFLKRTFGWTATAGGLLFLAISLPSLLGTPVGALSDRYGTRSLSVLGFATVAPSLALLGLIRWNTILDKIMLGVLLFVIGTGLNFILVPLAADVFLEAQEHADRNPARFSRADAFAQIYSLFNASLGLAAMAGPGLSGLLYDKTNWPVTVGGLAVICVGAAVPVYRSSGSVRKESALVRQDSQA